MLLYTPSAFIKQTHSPRHMADALSLGLRAFDGLRCPIQKPPGCIFEGGNIKIDTDGNKVLSNPECLVCGLTPKMEIMESSLEFDSEGVAQAQVPLSLTGSQRNRKQKRENLLEMLADPRFQLSASAQGEGLNYFERMVNAGFHKGGTGLDAVVHASVYFATRFDYNFIPVSQIIGSDSTLKKKTNRLVKRAIKENIRVWPHSVFD